MSAWRREEVDRPGYEWIKVVAPLFAPPGDGAAKETGGSDDA